MATAFTHPLVPVVAAYLIGRDKIPTRVLVLASFASVIPDLDVIGLRFGVSYGDQFGHRGFSHSLFFSAFIAAMSLMFCKNLKVSKILCFGLIFIGACSHGVLDAMTNGGGGIAFFWPLTDERYFFSWRPIEVSPIGIRSFISPRGFNVLINEFLIIWLPAMAIVFLAKRKLQILSRLAYKRNK